MAPINAAIGAETGPEGDKMRRIMEPEVMDNEGNAAAYARADFSAVNQAFVDRFLEIFPAFRSEAAQVLDLGCGPADIPIRLAKSAPRLSITAVDASAQMLRHAEEAVQKSKLSGRICLLLARVPEVLVPNGSADAVVSNSLVHHLPDPSVFWNSLRRFGHSGTAVYITDLFRPESERRAREIVETNAKDEHPILKEDFYNSLLAAFTLDEVRTQLSAAGLSGLRSEFVSDRHWLASGRL